jgi:hypothetical protein
MDRKERIEENEKLFREVNERVKQVQANFEPGPDPVWVCECGDETCFDKLTVPLSEYQDVRARSNWFLIKPGHEKLDVERVVEERSGYTIVQKDGV